eukprot:CAMPEP_0114422524 /NCGR_PEP_ID=MMETSP0103-20121206/5656_1 /TAXON_ID=37642 ORGANISM="Paraphysomonas imperforata, Strain PA2" /NCGR_SAMPLE_ID=MMETSP0103 /ASSEMBLY_ACC=CAM_ASM_000201 /LENGTH=329 /DNA_ID=CAMNT_0001591115 /DNA_START=33 /DNA_END=1018 /DNA_ORIENTATION=+
MFVNSTNTSHAFVPHDIVNFYAEQYDIGVATVLPYGYMEPNTRYFFDVKLCSRLNFCAYRTHKVEVSELPLPQVYVKGLPYVTLSRTDSLRLAAFPAVANCDGATLSTTSFVELYSPSYTWSVYDVNNITAPYLEIVEAQKYSSAMFLAPYTLSGEKTYKVVVTLHVSLSTTTSISLSTVYLIVNKAPVVPLLSPATYTVVPFRQSVVINASKSFDMDVSDHNNGIEASGHLLYNWTCTSLEISSLGVGCNELFGVEDQSPNHTAIEVISNSSFTGALYLIKLTLSNTVDSRTATASVEVFIDPDCCSTWDVPPVNMVNTQGQIDVAAT